MRQPSRLERQSFRGSRDVDHRGPLGLTQAITATALWWAPGEPDSTLHRDRGPMRPQPPHRGEATVTTETTHGPLAWDCSFDPDSERVASAVESTIKGRAGVLH